MRPEVSVVIRSHNEEKYLRPLIGVLKRQTISNIELILVVDYSSTETLESLNSVSVDKLITLAHEQFNHAYSTNLGVAAANGEFVAITNGHSLPVSERWLEIGLEHFDQLSIAGVTGLYTPDKSGSTWEKFYYSPVFIEMYRNDFLSRLSKYVGHHWFQTTNCMIRRDLWEIYPFDESLPQCEDYDWGVEMQARGYETIIDPDFSVYHSHNDGVYTFLKKQQEWERLKRVIMERTRPRLSQSKLPQFVAQPNLQKIESPLGA